MQHKNTKNNKTNQKTITGAITLLLATLTIPALSLIKIPQEQESSFTIAFDMTKNQDTAIQPTPDEVLEVNQTTPTTNSDPIFYLVQNHQTQEVISLTPTEYIKGVVSAEMPISFHEESLKAQAITAHSYALRQIENTINTGNNELNGAYITSDPAKHQACFFKQDRLDFWGENFDEYEEKLDKVVNEVITKIAVYENEPIIGAFHSISNGQTETASEVWGENISYLVSTQSVGDIYAPNYETTTTLTTTQVQNALKQVYPNIELQQNHNDWFSNIAFNDSGRVSSITVGDQTLTGHKLRTILNLRSASFTITTDQDNFIFTLEGYGHGVGLSQYGAEYMAQEGYMYDEILKHYYNGIEIVDISI